MSILFQFILIFILVMMFYNLRRGIIMIVAYVFLVPTVKIELAGFLIQQNFIYTIIVLITMIKYEWKRMWVKPFVLFCIFYGILLLSIPLKHDLSLDVQLSNWRANVMNNLFLPFVIWNVAMNDKKFIVDFRTMILFVIVLICVYGLFLTTTSGDNPYLRMIDDFSVWRYNKDYAIASGGRMFGRTSSVFQSPMTFAMFIGCSLFFLFFIKKDISNKLFYFVLFLLISCIITCGVRSVFGGLAVPFFYYLVSKRNMKQAFAFAVFFAVTYYWIIITPQLSLYFESILKSDQMSNEVGGSSLEMRLGQLEGCLVEIRNNPLWGKGFDWHCWYMEKFQTHPIILAFESLLFMVLCDNGFVGVFLWILLFVALYFQQYIYCNIPEDLRILTCIMLYYVSYCTITGDYGYMRMFMIFYYFMMATTYIRTYKKKDYENKVVI